MSTYREGSSEAWYLSELESKVAWLLGIVRLGRVLKQRATQARAEFNI